MTKTRPRLHLRLGRGIALALSLGGIGCLRAQDAWQPPAPLEISRNWKVIDASKVSDAGDAVSKSSYTPHDWNAATLPGTVLT